MTEFLTVLLGPLAMLAVGYGLGFLHGRFGWRARYGLRVMPSRGVYAVWRR